MPEIMTPPIKWAHPDSGVEYVMFTNKHTLADIARWILENKKDAEEILQMLAENILPPVAYTDLISSMKKGKA
jgi:hypothetical protein